MPMRAYLSRCTYGDAQEPLAGVAGAESETT